MSDDGETCERSEEESFLLPISSAEDSPARTYHPRVLARALLAAARDSSVSLFGLFPSIDQIGSSSKTSAATRPAGSTMFSVSWNSEAMLAYRSRSRRAQQELCMSGPESSLLPTLWASDGASRGRGEGSIERGGGMSTLQAGKKLLPTLTVSEGQRGAAGMGKARQGGMTLKVALVRIYERLPTLTASEGKRGSGQKNRRGNPTLTGKMRELVPTLTTARNLLSPSMQKWRRHRLLPTLTATIYGSTNNGAPPDGREEYATKGTPSLDSLIGQAGGQLSLPFCEWFMGFPVGWVTDLSDEVLAEYHKERSEELLETRSLRRAERSQATSSSKSSSPSRRKESGEAPVRELTALERAIYGRRLP